jgi:cell division protein FtsB
MADLPKVSTKFPRRTKKKDLGRRLKRYFLLTCIVFIGVLFYQGEYGLHKIFRLRTKIKTAQNEITQLKVQGADLKWEIDKLKADSQYIQLYASEHFGYAKPGVDVIQFVSSPQDTTK